MNTQSKLHRLITKFLPLITSAVLAACLAVGGLSVSQTGNQAEAACRAAGSVADAMTAILVDAQNQTRKAPAETVKEAQRKAAMKFYDNAINKLKKSKC